MTPVTVAWLSLTAVLSGVAVYWGYSLGGITPLRGLLGWPRRLLLGTGSITGVAAALWSPQIGTLIPAALCLLLALYALLRQWIRCPAARQLTPGEVGQLGDQDLLAMLRGGRAIPLGLLARRRTVRVGDLLVVHCALARSLACFDAPEGALRADLPHSSGFSIRSGSRCWDGVDGSALDGGDALQRRPLTLCSTASWRRHHPAAQLFAGDASKPVPPASERVPVLAAARRLEDPMRWGKADATGWQPLPPDFAQNPSLDPGDPGFLLSRWAAHVRGLACGDESA